jgi:arylsulfatase A-like enzyme
MSSTLSRRAFLRLLALSSLLGTLRPQTRAGATVKSQNRDLPNVLVLVFDALSARDLSVFGYPRETAPNLARFAAEATVYHTHYAAGNYTSPGVASILTGTYPWSHRAFHLHGTGVVGRKYRTKNLFNLFAEQGYYTFTYSHNHNATTLLYHFRDSLDLFKRTRDLCLTDDEFADLLAPNDYEVAYWSEWSILHDPKAKPTSLFLSLLSKLAGTIRREELAKQYEALFPTRRGLPELHTVSFVLEDAVDWMMSQVGSAPQPFFGYVHVLPPHDPYITRQDFVGVFRDDWTPPAKPPHFFSMGLTDQYLNRKRRTYDEYIAYADAEFGRLYDFLVETGALDNMYLVVTSDHGEMFERGIWGHLGQTLYEPGIRVPLLISKPGQRQHEDVYVPTNCVDLLPTLLQAINQPVPDWCEGQVLPPFRGVDSDEQRSIFSVEAKNNPLAAPLNKGTVALIKGRYKLIHYFGYPGHENVYELYDLASDPEELEDLSGGSVAAELSNELQEKLDIVNQPYVRG